MIDTVAKGDYSPIRTWEGVTHILLGRPNVRNVETTQTMSGVAMEKIQATIKALFV